VSDRGGGGVVVVMGGLNSTGLNGTELNWDKVKSNSNFWRLLVTAGRGFLG